MSREMSELLSLLEDVREYLIEKGPRKGRKEQQKRSGKYPYRNFSSHGPGPGGYTGRKRTSQRRDWYRCKRGAKKYTYRCRKTEKYFQEHPKADKTKKMFIVDLSGKYREKKKAMNKKYRRWAEMLKKKGHQAVKGHKDVPRGTSKKSPEYAAAFQKRMAGVRKFMGGVGGPKGVR
jgi:hypothetical protein